MSAKVTKTTNILNLPNVGDLQGDELQKATEELREFFAKEATENPDLYYENDVTRFAEDDYYCYRFLWHVDGIVKRALKLAKITLKWRKDFGVNEIKEKNLDQELFEKKGLYPYLKDKDGNENLLLFVSKLRKDADVQLPMKQFLIYWLEKLEKRCENGHGINVILNCNAAGIGNLDMTTVWFFVSVFSQYYPCFAQSIIVYDLPFLLRAIWHLIKAVLPKEHVERIRFVNSKSILELLEPETVPISMGGTSTYEYEHVPSSE